MIELPVVENLLEEGGGEREEFFELLRTGPARVERIVSHGQASEPGFWYEQGEDEWVMLLKGEAALGFEKGELGLKAGDALRIPAGLRHRVDAVSENAIWLAIHYTAE